MGAETVDIASRVKALRKKNGWRLHDLSEKTGISVATLSKLENGKTKLNFSTVNKLAQGIGVAVTDLTSPGLAHTKDTTMTLGGGGVVFETRDVDYEVLCADYTGGNQGYAKLSVKARTLDPNLPWHRHPRKRIYLCSKGHTCFAYRRPRAYYLKAWRQPLIRFFDRSSLYQCVSRRDRITFVAFTTRL
jgi:transcriptional regulator with XRE-family HTH domain